MRYTDAEIIAGYVLTFLAIFSCLGVIFGLGYAAIWLMMSFGGY